MGPGGAGSDPRPTDRPTPAGPDDSILFVDVDGVVSWANPATERVLGWAPRDLTGRPVPLLAADERGLGRGQLRRAATGEHVPPFVAELVRRDGSSFRAAVTLGALSDAAGGGEGVSIIVRDVTAELTSPASGSLSSGAYRAGFEQSAMPQALVALDGRFLHVNTALCEAVGRLEREVVGSHVTDLLHPLDIRRATEELMPLLRGEVGSGTFERLARHSDGHPLPLLLDVTVLREADGAPYALALFARDLTTVRDAQERMAAQENLYRALNRRSSDAAMVTDADLNILYVSPSVTELFGYQPEDVLMTVGWDFVHPDDVTRIRPQVKAAVAEPDRTERFSYRLKDAAGRYRWVEQTLTNCIGDPDIGGMVSNLRDITERVEAEQALQDSEARYRAIVSTAQEGIVALSPDGRTLFANEKAAEITGVSLEEIYRRGMLRVLPTGAAAQVEHLGSGGAATEQQEVAFTAPHGVERVVCVSASPLRLDDGTSLGVLLTLSDVTDARLTEDRLRYQALHDPLTNLPNRSLLTDRLAMADARHERSQDRGLAVLFLDLDEFKSVNDSRGHEVGDRLLKEIAKRLEGAVRRTDTVARLGGDEFAVVCEDADELVALDVAQRIHDALADPVMVDGDKLQVSASIGVALSPPVEVSALLRHADAAMYDAKADPTRNTVVSSAASG